VFAAVVVVLAVDGSDVLAFVLFADGSSQAVRKMENDSITKASLCMMASSSLCFKYSICSDALRANFTIAMRRAQPGFTAETQRLREIKKLNRGVKTISYLSVFISVHLWFQ
jgi:hypothetical protein